MGGFVLYGTAEELKSYRALKVFVVASYCSIDITTCTSDPPKSNTGGPPSTKSDELSLLLPDGKTLIAGGTNSILRALAAFAPASMMLTGSTGDAVSAAQVDGWMTYATTSIEIPLEALKRRFKEKGTSEDVDDAVYTAVKSDLKSSLLLLEEYLANKTYMVGDSITLADIALACVCNEAIATDGLDVDLTPGDDGCPISAWHDKIIHEDMYLRGKEKHRAASSSGGGKKKKEAPDTTPQLFNRRRIRIDTLLSSPTSYVGETVTVCGWSRTTRNAAKGTLLFVELNDGSCSRGLQCVLELDGTDGFEECKAGGGVGASFQFIGLVKESMGKGQDIELLASKAKLFGAVYGGDAEGKTVGGMTYPMSKKSHTLEFLRENAHLRPRTKVHSAAMRVRHAMAYATHKFFHENGFLYIHTPIVTAADCEGAGEQFGVTTLMGSDHLKTEVTLPYHEAPKPPEEGEEGEKSKKNKKKEKKKKTESSAPDPSRPVEEKVIGAVDYTGDFFGKRTNLTVSGQLNVETHCCALSDVYTFGPTFRAENSHTSRHLAEFWMIEPEIAFADLQTDIDLAEDYLKYCVKFALDVCAEDLEFFDEQCQFGEKGLRERLKNVLDTPFKRLTYTEGIEILQKAVAEDGIKFEEEPVWGIDLPSEHERYLCEKVFKGPVVLMDYPKEIKAFYMKLNDDGKTVAAADILVPKIGEIIGGSQREHRRDVLIERCIESHLDPKSVWWYLDLRRYGTVPHAGFGLGFERLLLFVTGLDNIRDVIPFPRWPGNADF